MKVSKYLSINMNSSLLLYACTSIETSHMLCLLKDLDCARSSFPYDLTTHELATNSKICPKTSHAMTSCIVDIRHFLFFKSDIHKLINSILRACINWAGRFHVFANLKFCLTTTVVISSWCLTTCHLVSLPSVATTTVASLKWVIGHVWARTRQSTNLLDASTYFA